MPIRSKQSAARYRSVLARLAKFARVQIARGTHLIDQNQGADSVYLLQSGLVKLARHTDGPRALIMGVRGTGALLGIEAALLRVPQPLTVVALVPCRVVRLGAKEFEGLLRKDEDFSWFVHVAHCQEVGRHLQQAAALASRSARERLEDFFRELRDETAVGEDDAIEVPLRDWELAQFLAVTPQYLSRLMQALRSDGTLERRNTQWFHTTRLART
jgi:CRP-like cAMP-binding protein